MSPPPPPRTPPLAEKNHKKHSNACYSCSSKKLKREAKNDRYFTAKKKGVKKSQNYSLSLFCCTLNLIQLCESVKKKKKTKNQIRNAVCLFLRYKTADFFLFFPSLPLQFLLAYPFQRSPYFKQKKKKQKHKTETKVAETTKKKKCKMKMKKIKHTVLEELPE